MVEDNVALLTTILLDDWNSSRSHEREVLAAVAVNVENPFISAMHVLLESRPGRENCSALQNLLENASNITLTQFGKVTCVDTFMQPVDETFVWYANVSMPVGKVLLSNPDVVYDDTLAQLPELVAGVGVHLLSVMPPPYEGAFMNIFGQQCAHRDERCVWTTRSWDAYVFRTPLPAKLAEKHDLLSFPMNYKSAEFYMARALKESGMTLTNPCMFVHAYHWHCFGQKMHAAFAPADISHRRSMPFSKTFPCGDFPEQGGKRCKGWYKGAKRERVQRPRTD